MKTHLLLTLGLTTLLTATASASQEQLAASIKEARAEATRAADQLKSTLNAVTALTKQSKGDLRPAYDTFAAEIPKTEAAASWTRTRAQWMATDGQRYFEDWQKSIGGIANDSLRKKAQKRLDAAKTSYGKVEASLKAAGEKFTPFLSDLTDIQKVLAKDVTPAGVKNVKGTISNANWRYSGVNSAIRDALKEMEKMEQSLSSEAK